MAGTRACYVAYNSLYDPFLSQLLLLQVWSGRPFRVRRGPRRGSPASSTSAVRFGCLGSLLLGPGRLHQAHSIC